MSEARSDLRAVGRKAHARSGSREAERTRQTHERKRVCCVRFGPPKRFERRETFDSPVKPRRARDSTRHPRSESCGRRREHTRCGCTQVVRVADVGWTHRASSVPGGRKASWSKRAQAGRKPVAPPDAGHGWREGETVRGFTIPIRSREFGLRVSACRLSIRRKALSGVRSSGSYRHGGWHPRAPR